MLWRGTYDIPAPRIPEVKTLYETTDLQTAKQLLTKYNVQYVYVGTLEISKVSSLACEKTNMASCLILFIQIGYF